VPSSQRREREAARRRYERRLARQAEQRARRRRRNRIVAVVVAALMVLGGVAYAGVSLSTGGKPAHHRLAASASPTPPPRPGTCRYTPAGVPTRPRLGLPPEVGVNHRTPYLATILTNRGTIKVELLPSVAPCAVNSFRYLAAKHYFDHTPCHRLTTAQIYVLQCGDPTGTGTGGPGYQFDTEGATGATYPAGTVAMANAGAGTNGSQFFFVYKYAPGALGPLYSPFGKVISGLSIIQQVAKAGAVTDGDGKPRLAVEILRVSVAAL
jgi:peptidyl-prolyl cis-trans isomerase B (cyclophilin B)